MYRFLVFAYENMYPYGGMSDCVLKTNSREEAEMELKDAKSNYDYAYIYDVQENTKID